MGRRPNYEYPYKEGIVKQSYLDNVLGNLNYYRYLVGSPEITEPISNRPDLQKGVVLQHLNLNDSENGIGLSHTLYGYPKPEGMDQAFYDVAANPEHNIISAYGYGLPVFSFFKESIFTYTAGHRNALLNPNVYKAEFGLGSVTYGDTYFGSEYASEGQAGYYEKMTSEFAAYPSPGYFPKQDMSFYSDWDIYLNGKLFNVSSTDLKNITATIQCMETGEIINYSVDAKNLEGYGSTLYLKSPEHEDYYTGDYVVTVKNVPMISGEIVDITYTVQFFDKFEGVTSDVKSIDYGMYALTWEGVWDEALIKKFLPSYVSVRLKSGSSFNAPVLEYGDFVYANDPWYRHTQYKTKPVIELPDNAVDTDGIVENSTFQVDKADSKYISFPEAKADKEVYAVGDDIVLNYTFKEYGTWSFVWYKYINGAVSLVTESDKYIISDNSLTIKNGALTDTGDYYVMAVPGSNMSGFSNVMSKAMAVNVKILPTEIQFVMGGAFIPVDGSMQFDAQILPGDATDKSVKWSSSNTNVAVVDETGLVRAVQKGTTVISASTSNGLKVEKTVTVDDYMLGDLDHNGKVDLSDVYLALRMSLRLDTPDEADTKIGNLDGNKAIDLTDVYLILRMSLGLK